MCKIIPHNQSEIIGTESMLKQKTIQSLNKYTLRSEEVCLLLTLQSWFVLIGSSSRKEGIEEQETGV